MSFNGERDVWRESPDRLLLEETEHSQAGEDRRGTRVGERDCSPHGELGGARSNRFQRVRKSERPEEEASKRGAPSVDFTSRSGAG